MGRNIAVSLRRWSDNKKRSPSVGRQGLLNRLHPRARKYSQTELQSRGCHAGRHAVCAPARVACRTHRTAEHHARKSLPAKIASHRPARIPPAPARRAGLNSRIHLPVSIPLCAPTTPAHMFNRASNRAASRARCVRRRRLRDLRRGAGHAARERRRDGARIDVQRGAAHVEERVDAQNQQHRIGGQSDRGEDHRDRDHRARRHVGRAVDRDDRQDRDGDHQRPAPGELIRIGEIADREHRVEHRAFAIENVRQRQHGRRDRGGHAHFRELLQMHGERDFGRARREAEDQRLAHLAHDRARRMAGELDDQREPRGEQRHAEVRDAEQLRERRHRGEPLRRQQHRDRGEDRDRRQRHDPLGHLEERGEHRFADGDERRRAVLDRGERAAEQHAEHEHRQRIAGRERADDVRRDHVGQELHPVDAAREVRRHRCRLRVARADAGPEQPVEREAERRGDHRHQHEEHEAERGRLAEPAALRARAERAERHRQQDQRQHHHLDRVAEQRRNERQVAARGGREQAEDHAEREAEDHLQRQRNFFIGQCHIELELIGFCPESRLSRDSTSGAAPFPRPARRWPRKSPNVRACRA
ncbi:hypothetical protein BURPS1710b_A1844 [Burkholderia pseudomallei 1710b]|uniref:Uncharacterized protein n=1 Tax=Burkholderia pseudomallei (strain 1710b) TaxID=320372 RepID=Q3JHF2_BURP1|nr:hypothetical protein BURPS1710b_A1844 [Burkholderia pseudomallei 1710b]